MGARIVGGRNEAPGIPEERCVVNIDCCGNTPAASIPLALAEPTDQERITAGDLILLSGFGAG